MKLYNVTLPVPSFTKPHCALALNEHTLLIAGYTGRPPRAYAAIVDLAKGSITPLPVPGLEGSARSEVLGCETTPLGPTLYGYVQYANGTLAAYLWLYENGVLKAVRLRHVTVVPLFVMVKPPLSYIVGFLGACTKGVVSAAYVLQGSAADLLSGSYRGRVYMPRIRAVNGSVYQVVAGRVYHCVYFTGAYILPTGDVEVIGYAVNKTGGTGFLIRLDGLFQVIENATLQPLLPVEYAPAGERGVAVGYLLDGSIGVAVYNPDGSVRYARISYDRRIGSIYPESLSCQDTLCVVGGYASNPKTGVRQGVVMFIGVSEKGVAFANTYTWSRVSDVPAVYISPAGIVYLVGLGRNKLDVIAFRIQEGAAQSLAAGRGASETLHAGQSPPPRGLDLIIPLAVILVSAAIVVAILLHKSRTSRR